MVILIPGHGERKINKVVFDFNGTLATDGIVSEPIKEALMRLSKKVEVVVLTADTNGSISHELRDTGITCHIVSDIQGGQEKEAHVIGSDWAHTATVGNGANDLLMNRASALAIAVIGEEGCFGKVVAEADIVVTDIHHVFNMFQEPNRIVATLRT